jgi:phenylacetic acid degradation operon negative regulatory protein
VTQNFSTGNCFCVTIVRVNSPVSSATQSLLRRFRGQRPIRGGSLLVTIFGDSIAPRGGVITLGSLIRLAAPFGLTERLVRTSVARLAQDDWLVARRDGRRSEYRLSPRGQQRFAEATQRIYGKGPAAWDGQWSLLILPANGGRRPDKLRESLRWLGFGQTGPGVFAHPNSDVAQVREWLRALDVGNDVVVLRGSSDDVAMDKVLVTVGWDLGDLARRYRRFVDSFAATASALSAHASVSCESAFIIRTLLIHEYRKIHLRDPLLPPALLPADWVGSSAYELCAQLYSAVFGAAEEFLTGTASTLTEPLPPAGATAYQRFGGIRGVP